MSEESRAMRAPNALRRPNKFIAYMRKYWFVYMLVLPGLVFMLVFDYGPMYGILLAFKDYSPRLGVCIGMGWAILPFAGIAIETMGFGGFLFLLLGGIA